MSDSIPQTREHIDLSRWVELAKNDPEAYVRRQVTEIVLHTIASAAEMRPVLLLKGGVLMGIAHHSLRQTTDIDLTAAVPPSEEIVRELRSGLNAGFASTQARLGYVDLRVHLQSDRRKPNGSLFLTGTAPALELHIAYAKRGSPQERLFELGRGTDVLTVDISFNEPTQELRILHLDPGIDLHAYALEDLIAEKLRAMIQQPLRNRSRRQDVYDLWFLISNNTLDEACKSRIHGSLIKKSRARNLSPEVRSIEDPAVRERSARDWDSLALEIDGVPEFDVAYEAVNVFYVSLAWGSGSES